MAKTVTVKKPSNRGGLRDPAGGRPPYEPTDRQRREAEAMAGFGIPHEDIANLFEIDAKTLRKHYRRELDVGHVKANAKVAETLWKKAVDGCTTSAIWWTKARMGWSEKVDVNLRGNIVFRMNFGNDA